MPANNEAGWIGRCLDALLGQDEGAGSVQVIVSANACSDGTEAIVGSYKARFAERGWRLLCLSDPKPGKTGALNRAEAEATGSIRVFLDADVICDPALLGQLRLALDRPQAAYATGSLAIARSRSWTTRRYASVWRRLPFVAGGAVGAGLFAVNAAGRARWKAFPEIISDDTFVRLHFSPEERLEVAARYHWPMVEGWRNLVRVRRRQDAGVAEVYSLFPHLQTNEAKAALQASDLLRIAAAEPIGLAVYCSVALAVRMRKPVEDWSRGR